MKKKGLKVFDTELGVSRYELTIGHEEWKKYSEWMNAIAEGKHILNRRGFRIMVGRSGNLLLMNPESFRNFGIMSYSAGSLSVYSLIEHAYQRGEIKSAEDALKLIRRKLKEYDKKYKTGLGIQAKIRHALNVKFKKSLTRREFPSVSDPLKKKMYNYIRKHWEGFDRRKDRVENALKEIFKGKQAQSRERVYSEADYGGEIIA